MLQDQCKKEVFRVHEFFVNWLNGTIVNNNDATFASECASVLADDLILIQTNGKLMQHDDLQRGLRQGHGSKKGLLFNMEIHNFQVLQCRDDWCLCMYQEWHYGRPSNDNQDGEKEALLNDNKRQCTAMFRRKADTPCGVEWVHIHETSITNAE